MFDRLPFGPPRRPGLRIPLALAVLLVAAAVSAQEQEISYFAHGSYLNAQGEVIEPSQAAIDAYHKPSEVRSRQAFTPRSHQEYCAACLAEGVPEPPAFDSGQWVSKGAVASQFTSSPVKDILVYESSSPAGICVALPRGSGATIELLGVICQSQSTGRACFWDNASNTGDLFASAGARLTATDIRTLDIAQFRNGDQLHENCTNCHRGGNVYLIHDELFNIPNRDPDQRYQPIPTGFNVASGDGPWGNPGRRRADDPEQLNLMRADGCGQSGCHATIPQMSRQFCGAVLKNSIERGEMPLSGALSESDREDLVCRDFCLLHAECALQGVGGMTAAKSACDCDGTWSDMADVARRFQN